MADSLGPPADGNSTDRLDSAGSRLRILLVDDHAGVREGLRDVLSDYAALEVVAEASDGIEAVALAHAERPDVIVMDVVMPRLDGVAATRRIRAELPTIVVLGLSGEVTIGRHPIEDAGALRFFAKTDAGPLIDQLLAIHAARGHPGIV